LCVQPVARQLALRGARPCEAVLGGPERSDRIALGGLCRVALCPGGGGVLTRPVELGGRHVDLVAELGEAVLLAQLLGGRRRTGCRPREAVPTQKIAVAVDEALAGIEQLLQAT